MIGRSRTAGSGSASEPLRLLVLTNDTERAPAPGMRRGYQLLAERGDIDGVEFVSWRRAVEGDLAERERLFELLADRSWDHLVIWSPRDFPAPQDDAMVDTLLAGRPLSVWEGDHWRSRRIAASARRYWLPRAENVFNSAAAPAVESFVRAGAQRVFTTVSGFDDVQFADVRRTAPLPAAEASVVMVASNPASWLRKVARPGAAGRLRFGTSLKRRFGEAAVIRGTNWPSGVSGGPVPFSDQLDVLRHGAITAVWDHYPRLPGAVSNRMSMSLLAGRPHVMTAHPNMDWMPSADIGLFREQSVADALRRVSGLMAMDAGQRHELGMRAHRFAADRLSQELLVRFIVSRITDSVPAPDCAPWTSLLRPAAERR